MRVALARNPDVASKAGGKKELVPALIIFSPRATRAGGSHCRNGTSSRAANAADRLECGPGILLARTKAFLSQLIGTAPD
jgi:hypothetical protein